MKELEDRALLVALTALGVGVCIWNCELNAQIIIYIYVFVPSVPLSL